MKNFSVLTIVALFAATPVFAAEKQCLLDLELDGTEYTKNLVASGETLNAEGADTLREFAKLPKTIQEVLVHGLAQQVPTNSAYAGAIRPTTLEGLLKEIADQDGTDLNVYRVKVKKFPKAEVYRVSMGLGENEYGSFIEVVGQISVPGQGKRALLQVVAEVNDGDIYGCKREFIKR